DGGPIAKAAEQYNALATKLADSVNELHAAGSTTGGATGLDFFAFTAGAPAATGLTVVPTSAAGIATGVAANGAADGSVAAGIADLFEQPGSVAKNWSDFVTTFAASSKAATTTAKGAETAASNALGAQAAGASVDMDEENVNLLMYQQAYQASARVLSAVDEALDTLINRTGLVGR
ncbi:MAG: flagellar basal body rod C-terminal domain-containing protein, partial [Microbacteriaceae bacterium]